MMKIVEKLQKDAQTRRADRKKLRKTQEKQGEFNKNLLKSLERIENKLDKESDSSIIESHQTSEGRRSRSAGRCWSPVLIMFLPILYSTDLHFYTQYHPLWPCFDIIDISLPLNGDT
jgi:hypothetical protein